MNEGKFGQDLNKQERGDFEQNFSHFIMEGLKKAEDVSDKALEEGLISSEKYNEKLIKLLKFYKDAEYQDGVARIAKKMTVAGKE